MSRLRLAAVVATIAPLLAVAAPASASKVPCGAQTAPDERPTFGRDLANSRTQQNPGDISPATAPTLQPVWSFSTGAAANVFSDLNGTPIVSGGCVHANTAGGDVVALSASDARTGRLLKRVYSIPQEAFAEGYAGTSNPYSKKIEHENTNAILKIDIDPRRRTFGEVVGSYKGRTEQYDPAVRGAVDPLCDAVGEDPSLPVQQRRRDRLRDGYRFDVVVRENAPGLLVLGGRPVARACATRIGPRGLTTASGLSVWSSA